MERGGKRKPTNKNKPSAEHKAHSAYRDETSADQTADAVLPQSLPELLQARFPDKAFDGDRADTVVSSFEYLRQSLAQSSKHVTADNVHAGHRTRLREAARHGIDLHGLSDIELVELLLSYVIPYKDTNVLAHKLLDRFGSVIGVLGATERELSTFPMITKQVAEFLPIIAFLGVTCGCIPIKLTNRSIAAEFFGTVYMSGCLYGTFAVYLDSDYRIAAVERYTTDDVPTREILCSICKYDARNVIVARRDNDMFPRAFDLATAVGDLAELVGSVGVRMLDYLIFTDYGYYTVGAPPKDGGWYPLYIFVPAIRFVGSPELYGAVMDGEHAGFAAAYADMLNAEDVPDILTQLCAAVKTS